MVSGVLKILNFWQNSNFIVKTELWIEQLKAINYTDCCVQALKKTQFLFSGKKVITFLSEFGKKEMTTGRNPKCQAKT